SKTPSSKTTASSAKSAKTEKSAKHEKIQGFDGQYTGGTVAAIPQFTNGTLDLSDKTALRFQYGKPVWTLPYSKISSIEVVDKKPNDFVHIPKLQKRKRIFTITFDGDKNTRNTMQVEMALTTAIAALPVLEERSGKQVAVEGAMNPDGWWGDRYW